MKRFWLAVLLLLTLLLGCGANGAYTQKLADRMNGGLRQAQALAAQGQWEQAAAYVDSVSRIWQESRNYREICLSHSHRDEVAPVLARLSAALSRHALTEFCTESSALSARLNQLAEAEQLTWANIL